MRRPSTIGPGATNGGRAPLFARRRGLPGDRRGASAIEFAIVGPLLISMSCFSIEVGLDMFTQQALDYATMSAARQVQIGASQGTSATADAFKTNVLCPQLPGFLTCDRVLVQINRVDDYYDTNAYKPPAKPDGSVDQSAMPYCNPGPATLMMVRAVYMAPVFTAYAFQPTTNFEGVAALPLTSTAALMTERFPPAASAGAAC